MIDAVVDKEHVERYTRAIRREAAEGNLDEPAAAAAQTTGEDVVAAIPEPPQPSSGGEAPQTPFIARDPITSLVQSTLEERYRAAGAVKEREGLVGRIVHFIEHLVLEAEEKMGPLDPRWVIEIGESVLERIAQGNHPFNRHPAEAELPAGDPRIIVVGDWGSGLPRAKAIGTLMKEQIEKAGTRPVAVIHLGDVYYSGTKDEYERNVLAPGFWPVGAGQPITSWSLNGNHDMYSGGWAYFDHLLMDQRFANQHSADGKPTSFFRLRTPKWDLVGLDTAWDRNVLSGGEVGVLEDPQAAFVKRCADEARQTGRALMLLSHHQYLSAFEKGDLGPTLKAKLGPILDAGHVRAWLWGHEHRCVGLASAAGIEYPRCIGHGGIPVIPYPQDQPLPAGVEFLERGCDKDADGTWCRFGFAVLDFDANGTILVTYYDDHGAVSPCSETLTPA